jgi:amino acid transporter
MKGKEPISMFCTNEPWLVAAAEVVGINIVRVNSWGDNKETRIRNIIPTIVMLVLVILLITGLISGKFKFANVPCKFTLTAISVFICKTPYEAVGGILLSFLIGAALFEVVVLVLASAGKKKALKETANTN